MSLLVSGYNRLESQGEGRANVGLLPCCWIFSHQGVGFGCLEVVMRNQWDWDVFKGEVLFTFSLFGDSQL